MGTVICHASPDSAMAYPAAVATAELDLRFIHPEEGERTLAAIEAIVAEANVPGARASLEITGEFEPLVASEASRRLFEHYAACAHSLGQTVESGLFRLEAADQLLVNAREDMK